MGLLSVTVQSIRLNCVHLEISEATHLAIWKNKYWCWINAPIYDDELAITRVRSKNRLKKLRSVDGAFSTISRLRIQGRCAASSIAGRILT